MTLRNFQRSVLWMPVLCGILAGLVGPAFSSVLNSPPQPAVNAAISTQLISYRKSFSGGAYTNGAWFGGASITLAVASHAGNTTADARLLQQIRHSIIGNNAICANGGYPAQHELHATGMFAIVKHTPRIWNQLTAAEKTKIDLLMKAALVSSAFTTSDNNPYVLGAAGGQRTLDADFNVHRGWNPNFREGMLGGILVSMVYFGGAGPADNILKNYSHAAFVAELAANSLTNTHQIFNWKVANPDSQAPSGTQIESAVRNYRYYGNPVANHKLIYQALANDTYGKTVNSGLNGGAGINGSGKIVSGAETLPNRGVPGMLKEFDSIDANGPRSAVVYAYDGYRPHQTNQLVLIIGGYWQRGGAVETAAVQRIRVGNQDLDYKLEKGYYDYHKGQARGTAGIAKYTTDYGYAYVWPLWKDVLLPYHDGINAQTDTDGDGTPDMVEIRLGLDPLDGTSRFDLRMTGRTLTWPSATGLFFSVQRSSHATTIDWQTIATIPGNAGTTSYTDPSPPPGQAFYRIGLNP